GERRKYVRLPVSLEIECSLEGEEGEVKKAQVKDITIGGVRIILDKQYQPGANLLLKIFLLPELEPIILKGRIVWQTKVQKNDTVYFETGVEFTDIEISDKLRIRRFMFDIVREILKELDKMSMEI
ncbi:MAG: hypothetical protein B6D55_05540, partial [Candidatus Omnitrophica bacterium 4484_70.2]